MGNSGAMDIMQQLRSRWSPKAFDPDHRVTEAQIEQLLEAARWAPSGRNRQPWRFAIAHRGDQVHATLAPAVTAAGSEWALAASVLIVNIVLDETSSTGVHDLGGAVQHMVLQGVDMGLHSRVFKSFDRDAVAAALTLPADEAAFTITAFGIPAPGHTEPQRDRKPLADIRLR